jgi:Ca2+-binding EF-hand superfamily protein
MADELIKAADTDGDGTLSADEIAKATGSSSTELSSAISSLDTDGDGKLSGGELTAGLQQAHRGRHGHHAHASAPSNDDLVASLVSSADSDQDGALSLAEVTKVLDGKDGSGLSTAFGKLDADGDGKLSSTELQAALATFEKAQGYGSAKTAATTTTSIAA